MQGVRIYEMPVCKMVSSGTGMFGDANFNQFEEWFSRFERGLFPKDFLYWDGNGFVWLYLFEEGMDIPPEFEVMDFQGGLYAVATDVERQTDQERLNAEVDQFLSENGFERDTTRPELGNIITSDLKGRK